MAQWYEPLVTRITAERKATLDGDKGGDLRIYGPLLLLLPPEQLAVLTMHTTIGLCLKHGPLGAKYSNLVTTLGETVQAERACSSSNLRRAAQGAEDAEGKRGAQDLSGRAGFGAAPDARRQLAREARAGGRRHGLAGDPRAKLGSALVMALLDVAKDDAGSPLLEHTIVYSNARKIGIIRARTSSCRRAARTIAAPRCAVPAHARRAAALAGLRRGRLPAAAGRRHAHARLRAPDGGVPGGASRAACSRGSAMGKVPWAVNGPVFDLVKAAWASGGKWPDLPSQEDLALPEPMDLAEALARPTAARTAASSTTRTCAAARA
ncbi:DNA-directed RNA polymerase [Aureococcus anophagefferens]|nr:DNA-directed RNA polymerase [Aureococcus anophagefferens]